VNMVNAIMNTNIPFTLYNNSATTLTSEFQGEIVSWIIIEAAFVPIAGNGI